VSKGVFSFCGKFPKRQLFKKTFLSSEKVMFQKIISLLKTAPFRLVSPTPPRYSECPGVGVGGPEFQSHWRFLRIHRRHPSVIHLLVYPGNHALPKSKCKLCLSFWQRVAFFPHPGPDIPRAKTNLKSLARTVSTVSTRRSSVSKRPRGPGRFWDIKSIPPPISNFPRTHW
jgi:hypothetical protein